MILTDTWTDYELLDAGGGEKLERWGDALLQRPDPQAIWPMGEGNPAPHARYLRSQSGGGAWEKARELPESWRVRWNELTFKVSPTGFKHTGLFPEQAANWAFLQAKTRERIAEGKAVRALNLFAYTGGATAALASAGAEIVHVDAAKGMVNWAKENLALSGLKDAPVRYIVDDVRAFVSREARRGRKYEIIVMDPPSYGRGPGGEVWKLEDELFALVALTLPLIAEAPICFVLNGYTTGFAPQVLANILSLTLKNALGGGVTADEIGLPAALRPIILPCGTVGRWVSGSI